MKNIVVLGANGMLGHMVANTLSKNPFINVAGTIRPGSKMENIGYDYKYLDVTGSDYQLKLALAGADWIINCIGIIKPDIDEKDMSSIRNAIEINSIFPYRLASIAEKKRVIQIATDCVYTGLTRYPYSEFSKHDAEDIYGITKSAGEVTSPNVINIRCSIIGPELDRSKSLLEWVVNQPNNAVISGYTNHLWNGVTTYAFAKLCEGIIAGRTDHLELCIQHFIPRLPITKSKLVRMIAHKYGRFDITVVDTEATYSINRVLDTAFPEINEYFWRVAGYKEIPTIEYLVNECPA